MSWFRSLACATVLSAVVGCGFQPLYGTNSSTNTDISADLAAIEIEPIADRSGQELRTSLSALLDPDNQRVPNRYRLAVKLKEKYSDSAIERSGFATRADLLVEANFTLSDAETGEVVLDSWARAASSFNVLPPSPFADYSTYTATNYARSRLLDQLAYEIRQRLGAYFAAPPAASATAE